MKRIQSSFASIRRGQLLMPLRQSSSHNEIQKLIVWRTDLEQNLKKFPELRDPLQRVIQKIRNRIEELQKSNDIKSDFQELNPQANGIKSPGLIRRALSPESVSDKTKKPISTDRIATQKPKMLAELEKITPDIRCELSLFTNPAVTVVKTTVNRDRYKGVNTVVDGQRIFVNPIRHAAHENNGSVSKSPDTNCSPSLKS